MALDTPCMIDINGNDSITVSSVLRLGLQLMLMLFIHAFRGRKGRPLECINDETPLCALIDSYAILHIE